jgi:hypothetical protein
MNFITNSKELFQPNADVLTQDATTVFINQLCALTEAVDRVDRC